MGYVLDNLELLSDIAKCIAEQFGPNCEVVLHDLSLPYDQTIVGIWNGHVTGRKVGDGGTNAGLEILKNQKTAADEYHYINSLPNGRILRSSSKYFRDEYGKINGSLCINYDITEFTFLNNFLQDFVNPETSDSIHSNEYFSGNVDDLLLQMLKEAISNSGKKLEELDKEDKVAIVHKLDAKGAFLIKKAAEIIADYLDISRYTVYNYLNQ